MSIFINYEWFVKRWPRTRIISVLGSLAQDALSDDVIFEDSYREVIEDYIERAEATVIADLRRKYVDADWALIDVNDSPPALYPPIEVQDHVSNVVMVDMALTRDNPDHGSVALAEKVKDWSIRFAEGRIRIKWPTSTQDDLAPAEITHGGGPPSTIRSVMAPSDPYKTSMF